MGNSPFSGVKVIELGQAIAAPYAAMLLADLGAEVIKIEEQGSRKGRQESYHTFMGESSLTIAMERNKKSLVLDLRKPGAKEIMHDLARRVDVVVDNFRPGVMARWGIDYESLSQVNPRIIGCAITGYGSSGPHRDRPAFDPIAQGASGLMSLTGRHPPERLITGLVDLVTGMHAAHGIMAALYERERTGKGQKVEVSLLSSALTLLSMHVPEYFITGQVAGEGARSTLSVAFSGLYQTRDGHIVFTLGGTHRFWPNLCRALGQPELEADPRFDSIAKRVERMGELAAIIEGITRERATSEWVDRMVEAGVPCGPVNTVREAVSDPQVLHQKMVVPLDLGGQQIKVIGNPIKLSGTPRQRYDAPPKLGEHTEEVLTGLLGYSRRRVEELRKAGVVL